MIRLSTFKEATASRLGRIVAGLHNVTWEAKDVMSIAVQLEPVELETSGKSGKSKETLLRFPAGLKLTGSYYALVRSVKLGVPVHMFTAADGEISLQDIKLPSGLSEEDCTVDISFGIFNL